MVNKDIYFNLRARDQASRALDRVGGKLGIIRSQGLAVGAGFAVVTMGIQAVSRGMQQLQQTIMEGVKGYRQFEDAMAEVDTMLQGESEQHLPDMRRAIEDLSMQFGKSAMDMANGMYQVLSASVDASQAVDVLRVATEAATAGLTDVETSVDAITTVLNAYSMSASEASHVSDVMFQTVKKGKIRYDELADSLGYVVSIASQAGVSFEQVAAAISTMTKSGIRANMAARSLRMIITDLMNPSEEAAKAASQYGVALDGLHLSVVGLSGIIDELNTSLGDNKTAWGEIFPNVRSLSGALALASNDAKTFKDDVTTMFEDSAGAASDAALEIIESGGFMAKANKQVMEKQKRDLGEGWDAIVQNASKAGMTLVHAFGGIASGVSLTKILWGDEAGTQQAIDDFYAAADAFGELWDTGQDVADTIDELKTKYREAQAAAKDDRSVVEKNVDALTKYIHANEILNNMDLYSDQEFAQATVDYSEYKKNAEAVDAYFQSIQMTLHETEAQRMLLQQGIKSLTSDIEKTVAEIGRMEEVYTITQNMNAASYAIKDFGINVSFTDSMIERIVNDIVVYQRELDMLKNKQWEYNQANRKLNLQMLKIQYQASKHRGRLTRSQKQEMEKLEQEQLRIQIKQQENAIETQKVQHHELEKAKDDYDKWMTKQQYAVDQLKDNHAEEMQDLQSTLDMMRQKRDQYQTDLDTVIIPKLLSSWKQYYQDLQIMANAYTDAGAAVPSSITSAMPNAAKQTFVNAVKSPVGEEYSIVDKFKDIRDSAFNMIKGSYDSGTSFVPETGLYQLHRGEAVVSKSQNASVVNKKLDVNVRLSGGVHVDVTRASSDDMAWISEKVSKAVRAGLMTGVNTVYD